MEAQTFHRNTAAELERLYADTELAPEGWRETLAWHWQQAAAYQEATDAVLKIAEARISELAFNDARRWTERALELLDQLSAPDRRRYEMRAYALTIAVLEFGGQHREALGYARLLLRLAEDRGSVEAQGSSYLSIGRVQRELGNLPVAEAETLRALELAERHQLYELAFEARLQLAKTHQMQGRHLEAFQQLELAQDVSTDDHNRLARVCTSIGDIYRVLGAGQEALELYHRALKLEIGSSNLLGQAMLYEKMGHSYLELDQPGDALQCGREALRLRITLNDNVGQARSHTLIGTVQQRIGERQAATQAFEQARRLEELAQNHRGLIIALTNLGDVAQSEANYEAARQYFIEGLTLAQGRNDQIALARMQQRMGDLNALQRRYADARTYWEQALTIREALGHSEEAITLRGRLSGVQE